jgi:hypothetical protein
MRQMLTLRMPLICVSLRKASSVTIGLIWQLESLGYFAKGLARESGEETVPELNTDEVVVFEEFFCGGTVDATSSHFH